jgi:hypothetical protein
MPGGTPVLLQDSVSAAGDEGYHDLDAGQASIVIEMPNVPAGGLAGVLSHELMETCTDWLARLLVQGPWKPPCWYEVCDPVQGQSYDVGGFDLSNFVTPAWFTSDAKAPYDFMGKLSQPFQVSPGGYVGLADASLVWGSEPRKAAGLRGRGARRLARTVASLAGTVAAGLIAPSP